MDLFADRTSAGTIKANQLRLWFASMAYVLVENLRRIALRATDLADASCGTIRRKLFKIGSAASSSPWHPAVRTRRSLPARIKPSPLPPIPAEPARPRRYRRSCAHSGLGAPRLTRMPCAPDLRLACREPLAHSRLEAPTRKSPQDRNSLATMPNAPSREKSGLGLSQPEFAKLFKLTTRQVADIERGRDPDGGDTPQSRTGLRLPDRLRACPFAGTRYFFRRRMRRLPVKNVRPLRVRRPDRGAAGELSPECRDEGASSWFPPTRRLP